MNRIKNETGLPNRVIAEVLADMITKISLDGIYVANVLTQSCYENKDSLQIIESLAKEILEKYSLDGSIQSGLDEIYKEDPSVSAQQSLGFYIETIIDLDWMIEHKSKNAEFFYKQYAGEKWMLRTM